MKNRIRMIGGVMTAVLLFSGLIVIASGSLGWNESFPLKIHRGEDCRDEMMDGLGVPREEIDRLEGAPAVTIGRCTPEFSQSGRFAANDQRAGLRLPED